MALALFLIDITIQSKVMNMMAMGRPMPGGLLILMLTTMMVASPLALHPFVTMLKQLQEVVILKLNAGIVWSTDLSNRFTSEVVGSL